MAEKSIQAGVSCIVLNSKDNVATLLQDVKSGEVLNVNLDGAQISLTVQENIKFGHKIAISQIGSGEHIIKYGESIGAATTEIAEGQHVHVHNIEGIRGRGDKKAEKEVEAK